MIPDPQDDMHDTCEPKTRAATIGVATPTENTIYSADEPRSETRHDASKPTPNVPKSVVATPPNNSMHSVHDPREAIIQSWQNDGERRDACRRDADSRFNIQSMHEPGRQTTWR
jgi:hypothetical protein